MKLYILEYRETLPEDDDPWDPWYDKMFSLVVRAENEKSARAIAAKNNEMEPEEAWLNPHYSTCEILSETGDEEIIIQNIHHA